MLASYTGVTKTTQLPTKMELVNDQGLSETQLILVKQLAEKHREIVELAKEVAFTEGRLKEKYVGLCKGIRQSGMNAKEFTLLLKSEGFYPSRISEIKKICSLTDEVFNKYLTGDIGRKMAIKIARTGDENVDEAKSVTEQAADGDAEEVPTYAAATVQPLVDPILPKLSKMLKMHKLPPGKHTALVEVDDYAVQILFTVKGKD